MYQKPILLSYFMFILQRIKLIVNMGNIEIKEKERRSRSIFKNKQRLRSHSPFRDALSPKNPTYSKFSPIKYTPTNSYYKGESLSTQKPLRKTINTQDRVSLQRTNTVKLVSPRDTNDNGIENRWKCQEIIKKVRNFNDFLVHLKKKLQQNSSTKNGEPQIIKGEVSMNVKLENQRIQLSKYKRLVERQLSKTHSIQQISIQNNSNGEKVLTIHYQNNSSENLLKESGNLKGTKTFKKPENLKDTKNCKAQQTFSAYDIMQPKRGESQINEENFKTRQNLLSKAKLLRQCKALGQVYKKKCDELNNQLSNLKKQEKADNHLQLILKKKQKNVKLQNLLLNLQQANRNSLTFQEKVRKLIS